jgi:hypothetical protein
MKEEGGRKETGRMRGRHERRRMDEGCGWRREE